MTTIAAAVAAATLAGCGAAGPTRLTAPGGAPVAQAGPRCGRWVVGLDAARAGQRILVLAGGQGTAEAPRFVADVVCQLGQRGPVLLALGWPRDVTGVANMMLGGSASAERRLREHALWNDDHAEEAELTTAAMWELMTQLAAWRAAGLDVKVVAFGPESGPDAYYNEESEQQHYQPAALREALRQHPDGTAVLWLGAAQGASKRNGGDGSAMGARLEEMELGFAGFRFQEPAAPAAAPAATAAAAPPAGAPAGAGSGDNPWASATVVKPAAGAPPAPAPAPAPHPALAPASGTGLAAPWAFERRSDAAGFDGVFHLGTTTAAAAFRAGAAAASAEAAHD